MTKRVRHRPPGWLSRNFHKAKQVFRPVNRIAVRLALAGGMILLGDVGLKASPPERAPQPLAQEFSGATHGQTVLAKTNDIGAKLSPAEISRIIAQAHEDAVIRPAMMPAMIRDFTALPVALPASAAFDVAALPAWDLRAETLTDIAPIIAPVITPAIFSLAPVTEEAASRAAVHDARPLVSQRAVTTTRINGKRVNKVNDALRRSRAVMRELGLTADSVIGHHRGRPLILKHVLADADIHQVPPARYYRHWVDALERYGFERQTVNIARLGIRHNLPPRLLNALIGTESGHYPAAVSFASGGGALGLGQIMPATAAWRGLDNPFDMRANIQTAANIMADNLRRSGGRVDEALARYNYGDGNVDKAMRRNRGQFALAYMPVETRGHATRTMRASAAFRAIERAAGPSPRGGLSRAARNAEQPRVARNIIQRIFAPR